MGGVLTPNLFCEGLTPFLLALTILLGANANHTLSWSVNSSFTLQLHLWVVACVLALANLVLGASFWWNLSGLLAGFLLAPLLLCTEPHYPVVPSLLGAWCQGQGRPGRLFLSAGFLLFVLGACIMAPWVLERQTFPTAQEVAGLRAGRDKLVTFLVFTAPRPNNVNHLRHTLESYLEVMPLDPNNPLFHLFRVVAFTTFAEHPVFEATKSALGLGSFASPYVDWVQLNDRRPPSAMKQREDFATGLTSTVVNVDTRYVAIVEDDMPLCYGEGWEELLRVLWEANRQVPQHCGLFVGTGGSGLILRSDLVSVIADLLRNYEGEKLDDIIPADVVIQECLRGELPQCAECAGSLVTSPTMLMYHTGAKTSTGDRVYQEDMWQCGWRQPFNGEPDVHTL